MRGNAAQITAPRSFTPQTVRERFSEGASGAFFCESHDGKYVIKSMHRVRAKPWCVGSCGKR